MNWIFITAGVGSEDFENAAARLAEQMMGFGVFSNVRVFKTSDVEKYCPELKIWYPNQEFESLKGYGWYVWKSRFAKIALDQFPEADGIMYLDAGCEALPNVFSKRTLLKFINLASTEGACVFKIPTPEIHYTKRLLLSRFKFNPEDLDGYQFQSGSWLFSREIGTKFIHEWDRVVWEDKRYCDESESPGGEHPDFKINRYDQSVYSPLVRRYGFSAYNRMPPGRITGTRGGIRLFFFPFAWARNRSGLTQIKPLDKFLAQATLRSYRFFDEAR